MTADEYVVIDSELQTCQCMDDSDTLDRPWSLPSLASRVVAVDKGEDGRKDDELSQSGCISGGCHHDWHCDGLLWTKKLMTAADIHQLSIVKRWTSVYAHFRTETIFHLRLTAKWNEWMNKWHLYLLPIRLCKALIYCMHTRDTGLVLSEPIRIRFRKWDVHQMHRKMSDCFPAKWGLVNIVTHLIVDTDWLLFTHWRWLAPLHLTSSVTSPVTFGEVWTRLL